VAPEAEPAAAPEAVPAAAPEPAAAPAADSADSGPSFALEELQAGGVPDGVDHLKKEKERAAAEQAAAESESGPTFTLQELQKSVPAPDGVDVTKRETYLANADFQAHFGMDKAAFTQLPGWKQTAAKKKLKLY
jgi:hypothetical protein